MATPLYDICHNANMNKLVLTEEQEVDFCELVGDRVEQDYGYKDGADLCFNLLEMGVINEDASIGEAAQIVAQHIAQA